MNKARIFPPVLLSILLPLLALLAACAGDDATPTEKPIFPTVPPVEAPRPLTAGEREAIGEFADALQALQEERDQFYQEFETWKAGLVECHPATARETMAGFAASFTGITGHAANLPRTVSTSELADLIIPAAEAEETSLRHLRDRWQSGNVSLFEAVELRRDQSLGAQNDVEDRSLALQEEFEEGATEAEVKDMEEFADVFDEITDDWDDHHEAYRDLRKTEDKLTQGTLRGEYLDLIENFEGISTEVSELTAPLGNEDIEDIIETMQDLAKAELAALNGMAASLLPTGRAAGRPAATPAPDVAQTGGQAPPAAPGAVPQETSLSPLEQLEAAVGESIDSLEDISRTIEETVDDKSAQYLTELEGFNAEYQHLVQAWDAFHSEFDGWRESNGGCDQVEVTGKLEEFSQGAAKLGRMSRDLPQTGFLPPIYSLVVEAAVMDEAAMRTLYNSWRPFAVDVFRAVDEARLNSERLRRRAGIALQELQERP